MTQGHQQALAKAQKAPTQTKQAMSREFETCISFWQLRWLAKAYSVRAGTKISRCPLLLIELTKPAFSISSTKRAARL